jgi:hypothetical protein
MWDFCGQYNNRTGYCPGPPISIIPPLIYEHISFAFHQHCRILATSSVVKKQLPYLLFSAVYSKIFPDNE